MVIDHLNFSHPFAFGPPEPAKTLCFHQGGQVGVSPAQDFFTTCCPRGRNDLARARWKSPCPLCSGVVEKATCLVQEPALHKVVHMCSSDPKKEGKHDMCMLTPHGFMKKRLSKLSWFGILGIVITNISLHSHAVRSLTICAGFVRLGRLATKSLGSVQHAIDADLESKIRSTTTIYMLTIQKGGNTSIHPGFFLRPLWFPASFHPVLFKDRRAARRTPFCCRGRWDDRFSSNRSVLRGQHAQKRRSGSNREPFTSPGLAWRGLRTHRNRAKKERIRTLRATTDDRRSDETTEEPTRADRSDGSTRSDVSDDPCPKKSEKKRQRYTGLFQRRCTNSAFSSAKRPKGCMSEDAGTVYHQIAMLVFGSP